MSDATTPRSRAAWSASAKRTFRDVVADHPDLEMSKLSGLYAACDRRSTFPDMNHCTRGTARSTAVSASDCVGIR